MSSNFDQGPLKVLRKYGVGELLFRRWAGTVVDTLVLGVGFLVVALAFAGMPEAVVLSVLLGFAVMVIAYYCIGEGLWGRTLGKLASGMIVVDADGNPPGVGRAALRTLARLVEVNPFLIGGLPAAGVIALNEKRQRLGDMMAGTYVIPFKELARATATDVSVF